MAKFTESQTTALTEARNEVVNAHSNTLRALARLGLVQQGSIFSGTGLLTAEGLVEARRVKAESASVVESVPETPKALALVGKRKYDLDRSTADSILLYVLPEEDKKVDIDAWGALITRFLEAWYLDEVGTDMHAFAQEWVHGPYRNLVVGEPEPTAPTAAEQQAEARWIRRLSDSALAVEFLAWMNATRSLGTLAELYRRRSLGTSAPQGSVEQQELTRTYLAASEQTALLAQRSTDAANAIAVETQRRNDVTFAARTIARAAQITPETKDFALLDDCGLPYDGSRSAHVLAALQRSDKTPGLSASTHLVAAALYKCFTTDRMNPELARWVREECSPYDLCLLVARIESLYQQDLAASAPDSMFRTGGVGYLADHWINENAEELCR